MSGIWCVFFYDNFVSLVQHGVLFLKRKVCMKYSNKITDYSKIMPEIDSNQIDLSNSTLKKRIIVSAVSTVVLAAAIFGVGYLMALSSTNTEDQSANETETVDVYQTMLAAHPNLRELTKSDNHAPVIEKKSTEDSETQIEDKSNSDNGDVISDVQEDSESIIYKEETYEIGSYKLLYVVRVRENAGTQYKQVSKSNLSSTYYSNSNKNGSLTKGTIVEISEFKVIEDGSLWGKIDCGWLCLYLDKPYVSKM